MFASTERRRRDRELQRAAANRRVGHDHAYLILFGPAISWGLVLLAVVVAGIVAWHKVPHATIAGWLGGAGILILAGYAAWVVATGTVRARMSRMAKGQAGSSAPHLTAAAGALMLAAAVLIWSQG